MRTFLVKILAALALGTVTQAGTALGQIASEAVGKRFNPPTPAKRRARR